MPYDANFYARSGEEPVLTAQFNAPIGSLYTIVNGTFTLTRSDGTIFLGPSSISGSDPGALAQPQAYYLLNTTPFPAPAVYSGLFSVSITSNADSITRILDYNYEIILAQSIIVEGAAYDPTTLIGQVRFHVDDKNLAKAIFTDAELIYCLSFSNQNPILAAAWALEQIATSDARLAYIVKIGEYMQNKAELSKSFCERAKRLRSLVIQSTITNSPKRIFDPNYGQNKDGNMGVW